MSVGLGPEVWVVLSGFEAMKEFCMLEEAVARPNSPTFHEIYSFAEVEEPLGKQSLLKIFLALFFSNTYNNVAYILSTDNGTSCRGFEPGIFCFEGGRDDQ
jgi:hypothetical protein